MKLPTLSKLGSHGGPWEPDEEKSVQMALTKGSKPSTNLPNVEVKLEKVCQICRRQRRGAAAVEFAVVAPVFFLLIFGMIEYGRMVMVQQVLTNASREGARVGVVDPPTGQASLSQVTSTVNTYLTSAGISGATITAYISTNSGATWTVTDPSNALNGQPVKVSVSVPFSNVSWLPTSIFGNGGKILQASTVMRRETVQ